jgi:RNA polymerase sigma factor (sigma-70 family)
MDVLPTSPWEPTSPALHEAYPYLVRLCATLSGDPNSAEDLAQETLLTAWRRRAQLQDPQALTPWLVAIARNICRHSLRTRRRATPYEPAGDALTGARQRLDVVDVPDPFDLAVALERDELATLLDRALALLPPDTRDALIQHYIAERPHAEIAARLGISSGTFAVRLHRGKLALRRILLTTFPDEADAYGLVPHPVGAWRKTRIWCPICGERWLVGRFADGQMQLDCIGCLGLDRSVAFRWNSPQSAATPSMRSALDHLLRDLDTTIVSVEAQPTVPCPSCGRVIPFHISDETFRGFHYLATTCSSCGREYEAGTSVGCLALAHPQGRQFWRRQRRIRVLPECEIEVSGRPALLATLQRVGGGERMAILFARDTLRVLAVDPHAAPA